MTSSSQQSLQLHPEKAALLGEIEQFGETLTNLIVRRDHLQRSILPQIAAEYQLKIGHLETRVFWLDCELRALKRRIELAQAMLNAGDKPCYQCIEQQINCEFAKWRAAITEKQRAVRVARSFAAAPKMTHKEAKKLHTLYRSLAKKLHPDVAGEQGERAVQLWRQTADAYRAGDTATLEALWLIVENNAEVVAINNSHTLESVREKRHKLLQIIIRINDEIYQIRRAAPYIWQNILCDESEVRRRRLAAAQAIEDLHKYRLQLTEHWATVMQSAKDGEFVPNKPPALVAEETGDIDLKIIGAEFL